MGAESNRLDSWKAIAEYLGRDVSTARRWEKTAGMPVRRLPGSNGRSVFAYRDEIDAWRNGTPAAALEPHLLLAPEGGRYEIPRFLPPEGGSHEIPPPVNEATVFANRDEIDAWLTRMGPDAPAASRDRPDPLTPDAGVPIAATAGRRISWRWLVGSASVVAVVLSIAWQARTSRAGEAVRLQVTADAIVGVGQDGTERWRYRYPSGHPIALMLEWNRPAAVAAPDDPRAFITGIGARPGAKGGPDGGQLFYFAPDGVLRRTFTFEDRVSFGGQVYTGPWALTDFEVEEHPGARRIAVAAHHYQWWPSLVTVLDETWRRRATFVHAGWVERVHWASRDRLIVTGFSNARDGGMIALLDANALDGQSPAAAGTPFACTSCGGNPPLRYVVLPRSEVNRVTGSPFNRAVLEVMRDRLIVRTIEVPSDTAVADALYEFTPSLDLIRASYSDRYWDEHAGLEQAGTLAHSRAACPDRDGPPALQVWDPSRGWTVHTIHAPR